MDKQTAKNKLKELRDSLSEVLDGKNYQSADEIKEQSKEAIQQARSASKQLKKSLLEKIKDLPVVQKVSELGTAGSVAVSTAAVAQTSVAVDQTEVFVASVANDIVEERIEVPMFIDNFIDFHELNDWGQAVIAEKIAEVSELQQISQPVADAEDTTQETSVSSQSASAETPDQTSQPSSTDKSLEKQSQEQESKEESSSNDQEQDKEDKQQSDPEQKTEDKKESQEKESSSETSTDSDDVKDLPIIETPFDNDPSVRSVSPTT